MIARASLFDVAFAATEDAASPSDFAVLAHFEKRNTPPLELLEQGAARARSAYPRSSWRMVGHRWTEASATPPPVALVKCPSAAAVDARARALLHEPLTLADPSLLQQTLLESPDGAVLVTRVHHALGDLLSATLWLRCQLEGFASEAGLALRTHASPARRSAFAGTGPSPRMATTEGARPSGKRRWLGRQFSSLRPSRGVSYNDLLGAVALGTLRRWNEERGVRGPVALWMPVNIRERPFEGFGNGSSRIRVYAPRVDGSFISAAAQVREQVRWSKEHGEWSPPGWSSLLTALPSRWTRALLRRQASSNQVDMATTLFSHASRLCDGDDADALPGVERLEIVTHLIPAHPLTIAAAGLRGTTHLTFTWDEGCFTDDEAARFVAIFDEQRQAAFVEVGARA